MNLGWRQVYDYKSPDSFKTYEYEVEQDETRTITTTRRDRKSLRSTSSWGGASSIVLDWSIRIRQLSREDTKPLTSISASRSAAVLAGRSVLLRPPPRPLLGLPPLLRTDVKTKEISSRGIAYLAAPSAAGAAGAGATREANDAGRDGSTTISIFMGRSV